MIHVHRARSFLGLAILVVVTASACGNDDDKAPTVPVVGKDLSGTYRFDSIQCVNAAGTAVTGIATVAAGSPQETLTITGNAFAAVDVGSTCTTTTRGRVVFTPSASDPDSGDVTFSGQVESTSNGGACTQTVTITNQSGGTISPTSSTDTATNGASLPTVTTNYAYEASTGELIIPVGSYTIPASPTDICLFLYDRQ